jgi:hypothetical protein
VQVEKLMPKDEKITSLAAAALLVSGLSLGMCADARAEATTTPKQSAYPPVHDLPAKPDKPAMTADEQSKLKKDLINARDRQSRAKAKEGTTRPKPIKP